MSTDSAGLDDAPTASSCRDPARPGSVLVAGRARTRRAWHVPVVDLADDRRDHTGCAGNSGACLRRRAGSRKAGGHRGICPAAPPARASRPALVAAFAPPPAEPAPRATPSAPRAPDYPARPDGLTIAVTDTSLGIAIALGHQGGPFTTPRPASARTRSNDAANRPTLWRIRNRKSSALAELSTPACVRILQTKALLLGLHHSLLHRHR